MKKRIISGIQPTGTPHIGNFLGALSRWVKLQDKYECIYFIADYHAITVSPNPQELRERITDLKNIILAIGVDPKKTTLFVQSDIPQHTELAWILNAVTPVGELERMTQYKEKKNLPAIKSVNAGLLNYPILQAADILLYDVDIVPVGDDQIQHVEFTRTIAKRFNAQYKNIFKIPEAEISEKTARIMSLQNPLKKMSKTGDETISILDPPDVIKDKIKRAVTDSGKEIKFNPKEKPAVSNLLNIYSAFSAKKIGEIEKKYTGAGYAKFKEDLAKTIIKALQPIQNKYKILRAHENKADRIMQAGKVKAEKIAENKLKKVKEIIGIQ